MPTLDEVGIGTELMNGFQILKKLIHWYAFASFQADDHPGAVIAEMNGIYLRKVDNLRHEYISNNLSEDGVSQEVVGGDKPEKADFNILMQK